MNERSIKTWYYRQFDADYNLDVPAKGYGGWNSKMLPFDPSHSALVVMHAWDCGTRDEFPGWYRAVEYIERANQIARGIFPPLLDTARKKGLGIIHVADDSGYADNLTGHKNAAEITKKYYPEEMKKDIPDLYSDHIHKYLISFKRNNSFPGPENIPDIEKGRKRKTFFETAVPLKGEPVVVDSEELHSICIEYGYNHLVYIGFAINWCLQYSPGNMNDMADQGILCSAIKEAVTAVENKESAKNQKHREYGLWVTALKNGFVYELDDFIEMLNQD